MNTGFQIRGDANNPYHLSVGAVILQNLTVILIRKIDGTFTLPRETMYSHESLENSLVRGVQEEIGVTVSVERYLGSLNTFFNRADGTKIEKTTLYFLVTHKRTSTKNQEPDEVDDDTITVTLTEAVEMLKKQGNEEYKILQRIDTKQYM